MAKVSSFNNAGYVTSYSTIPHHMIKLLLMMMLIIIMMILMVYSDQILACNLMDQMG